MSSKLTIEYECQKCGAEYMITFDEENIIDQPIYCPFCSGHNDNYDDASDDLSYGTDD